MYEIDSAGSRKKAPVMSAYPRRVRTFSEPVTATNDVEIGEGRSLPDLIRLYYEGAVPTGFSANFGFLDRDDKVRKYQPGITDKYVFRSMNSLNTFREHAHELADKLCELWRGLGYSTAYDEDRELDFPDSSEVWKELKEGKHIPNLPDIYFILANSDIVKRACVVRTINAGWWAVSYAGKNAPNKKFFSLSLRAHDRAIATIMSSSAGKAKYTELWRESSDPLLTNPGYPFFTAQVDKAGNPITRLKTVDLFRDLGRRHSGTWEALLEEVDKRAGKFGMEGHPFCIAPLRRLQPGRKWQHQFNVTPSGLRTAFDEKGVNSQRVAHMVPYVYNVLTAPVSTLYKTVRYFLPGCYHDGAAKQARLTMLRTREKSGKAFLAEADYSNFDRFMPVDLIEDIVSMFTKRTERPDFWHSAMMYLHKDASLVWPDYTSDRNGFGWLFKPGRLGLLSGVKATSETGTLVNSVVNAEALARLKGWSEDELTDYLLQYLNKPVGTEKEYFYVQSDDTQLIADSAQELGKHAELFMQAVQAAGLKGSVELADRFLMRHMQAGADRPVPARVWQNTLSNESPPESEIIFLAGLAARTDGLLGLKSVDPFQTGTVQAISKSELEFTKVVLSSLRRFVDTASHRSSTAIELLDRLLSAASNTGSAPDGGVKCDASQLAGLTSLRQAINATLAQRQLDEIRKVEDPLLANGAVSKWLYELYRDKNAPSAAAILADLTARNPTIVRHLQVLSSKEEAFFRFASKEIGVSPLKL